MNELIDTIKNIYPFLIFLSFFALGGIKLIYNALIRDFIRKKNCKIAEECECVELDEIVKREKRQRWTLQNYYCL